jgi:glycosyltransferase involved in cell wall biosynthesis
MSNNQKVSVIITTYNRDKLLEKAILSVINQTYQNYEIIVIDDASSQNNKLIIDKFPNIIYYKFNKNQGGNICRNKGIELSSGDYIAFLDDDDTWIENKLEKQIKFMIKNNLDFSYTGRNIIKVDDKLNEISRRYSFSTPKYNSLKKSIMQKNFIGTTSSIMFKKTSLILVGGFDKNMPMMQDYELYIRALHKDLKVEGLDEALVNYYIYISKKSVGRNFSKFHIAKNIMIDKFKYFENINLLKKTLFKDYLKRNLKLLLYKLDQRKSK